MNEDFVTRQALEDGTALLILKTKYLQTGQERELYPFLNCLRDSEVYVPVNVLLSDEDGRRVSEGHTDELLRRDGAIRMRPEFLTSGDGKRWLPIFSQSRQLPDGYRERLSVVKLDILQCLRMAHAAKDLSGLVLDAFTKPAVLPFQVADLLPRIPSRLASERPSEGGNSSEN